MSHCSGDVTEEKRPLVVGINALYINWGFNGGTETYLTNTVVPWYEGLDIGIKYIFYCSELPPWYSGDKGNFKFKVYPRASKLAFRVFVEQFLLPFEVRFIDVLWSPGYVLSFLFSKVQVVSIHDGFAWRFGKEIGVIKTLYWKFAVPISAKIAKNIISISNSSAVDIVEYCKVKSDKISTIYLAGSQLSSFDACDEILSDFRLSKHDYFLCVGFFKEIKNPYRIIEAYIKYRLEAKDPKSLVLVGVVLGKSAQSIYDHIKNVEGVVVAGKVTDEALSGFYQNSSGLIFVSLYEGFGIPVLEAQMLGCPVVTSNNSAMAEISGEHACLVDPYSVEDIAKAMLDLDCFPDDKIIQAGKDNAALFSWERVSNETLKLIESSVAEDR
ncbi:MAG: glycosyltransferase involved in cell wall biosynthesis [Motiliproteus sp.]|jgi:glycosyltransferase involved in cell wall biosynthesis